jgi:hypothetical protein
MVIFFVLGLQVFNDLPWLDLSNKIKSWVIILFLLSSFITFITGCGILNSDIDKFTTVSYLDPTPNSTVLAWVLSPTITFWVVYIISTFFWEKTNDKTLYICLFVASIFIVILLLKSLNFVNLDGTIKKDYTDKISKLKEVIKTLCTVKNKTPSTYQDVYANYLKKDPFSTYLVYNIKSVFRNTDPDPNMKIGDLYAYVMHQTNGKELDSFLLDPNVECNYAQAISKYYTAKGCDIAKHPGLREILKDLRNYNNPKIVLDDLNSTAAWFGMLLLLCLIYPAFHEIFKQNSVSTVVCAAISVIIAFWFTGVYGWANQV